MRIGQLRLVTDLDDGCVAHPEPNIDYQLQSADDPDLDTLVEFVVRRGERLIARGTNGQEYAVSGHDRYEMKTVRRWNQN